MLMYNETKAATFTMNPMYKNMYCNYYIIIWCRSKYVMLYVGTCLFYLHISNVCYMLTQRSVDVDPVIVAPIVFIIEY